MANSPAERGPSGTGHDTSGVAAERDELRRVLYEAAREVPTSDAGVHKHHDLQHLHRRIIAALREEEPDGEWVTYDYWIGRYP